MNNTSINENKNIYSIDNLVNKCQKDVLNHLVDSIEKLDNDIKESKSRKSYFKIKGIYKRTITTTQGTITYKRRLYIDKKLENIFFLLIS